MADRWEDWFEGDERLIWEGAPMPGIRHWVRNILGTIFGAPFLGAGLTCLAVGASMVFTFKLGDVFLGLFLMCFSVPFILIGAAMVFGVWYADFYAHKFVRYALSDKRGYIATRWWKRNMEILEIRPDHAIEVDGGRNVYFHTTVGYDSDGDRTMVRKGFEDIADAHEVYRLVRAIQAGDAVEPV